jgi:hypothetical protein
MEIIPHAGIERIKLGANRTEIIGSVGEPAERDIQTYPDGTSTEYLEYPDLGLSLGFTSEDGDRLGTITVRSRMATLDGRTIIGRPIEEILSESPGVVLDDDFEENGQDYIDENRNLSIWVLEGLVNNVTVFPDWIDDDTPRWP